MRVLIRKDIQMHSSDQFTKTGAPKETITLSEYSGYSYLSVIVLPWKATDRPEQQSLLINHSCVETELSLCAQLNIQAEAGHWL